MNSQTLATVLALLTTVTVKSVPLFALAYALSVTVWRNRPAWRSWAWLMFLLALPVLAVLELLAGVPLESSAWFARHPELLALAPIAFMVSAVLFGLLISAAVRIRMVRGHTPRLRVDLRWRVIDHEGRETFATLPDLSIHRAEASTMPTTCGVFLPAVVLPVSLPGTVATQLTRTTLLYGLHAVLRFDAQCVLLARLVQCVFFMNPLVWPAFSRYRRASEEVCDWWAVHRADDPGEYAVDLRTLGLHLPSRPWMSPDAPIVSTTGRALVRRLARLERRIARIPETMQPWAVSWALIAWLLLTGLLGALRLPVVGAAGPSLSGTALIAGLLLAVGVAVLLNAVIAAARTWRGPAARGQEAALCQRWVVRCARKLNDEWQDVKLLTLSFWRTAGPAACLVSIALLIMVLAISLALNADHTRGLYDPYWQLATQ